MKLIGSQDSGSQDSGKWKEEVERVTVHGPNAFSMTIRTPLYFTTVPLNSRRVPVDVPTRYAIPRLVKSTSGASSSTHSLAWVEWPSERHRHPVQHFIKRAQEYPNAANKNHEEGGDHRRARSGEKVVDDRGHVVVVLQGAPKK